ncbi:hypothetical protein IU436_02140 [Nocardia farcinica]|uniref:Uncharacterized protein n=1 Tax=Nocardia farcinica TaxID=37329 RepID=A0A449H0T1_NOCFR|nr:hypothetical protein [Nocardia farcinica]MBF6256859.1 hypothetical protein [Nocardia farcinica]MBF6417344.1 hypothetical protein [Nocardia farcinica]MBF6429150.1 hypothetical protein [Nocardia farcinica]MBF6503789.1 hypothetical protein [Nocardia farcinica]MBF6575677.1 hypothetical protein [Nocardia farcinica]
MSATCPTCAWPTPSIVSTHRDVRYLRCLCGTWIVQDRDQVIATAGESAFPPAHTTPDRPTPEEHRAGPPSTEVGSRPGR